MDRMSIFDVVFDKPERVFPSIMSCYAELDIFVVPAILLFIAMTLLITCRKYWLYHAIVASSMLFHLWAYDGDGC